MKIFIYHLLTYGYGNETYGKYEDAAGPVPVCGISASVVYGMIDRLLT
ncbi:MAG: hypothetical protein IJP02_03180 [Oscillospiraceae bacterium]|nr:hypothetical protein [Oscillospiraceae bacterium]